MKSIFMSELFLSLCASSQVEQSVKSSDGTVGASYLPAGQVATQHCTLCKGAPMKKETWKKNNNILNN